MKTMIVVTSILVFVACGEAKSPPSNGARQDAPASSSTLAAGRYRAAGVVLEDGGSGAVLCVGSLLDSLPPQCSGIPLQGWDWQEVSDVESAGGTKWGSYEITGSYDGAIFTVMTTRSSDEHSTADEPAIENACPTPSGGWPTPQPQRMSEQDLHAAIAEARAQSDHAAAWIVYIEEPTEETSEPGNIILNLAFTGDPEAHETHIRKLWGGPLCVVAFEHTLHELRRVQKEIQEIGKSEFDLDVTSSGVNEVANVVEIGVVAIDAATRADLDARYGAGLIDVNPQLIPLP